MFGLAVVFGGYFFFVCEEEGGLMSVGSVYGAFQGYARAFYAELLPPGEEARWYGLFSITDKVSSSFLPLSPYQVNPVLRFSSTPLVLLVSRPADCRSYSGHDGKHPLRVLLPCCDDMAGCTRADECGCAEGKRGCKGV